MNAVKKGLPRVRPLLSKQASAFVKKRRIASQQTLDTNIHSRQDRNEVENKINQDEVNQEIYLIQQIINTNATNLLRRQQGSEFSQLNQKQAQIQGKKKEIADIKEQIENLKQIYQRPKGYTPADKYSRQHLQQFTLAKELTKQRKHLQLHIDHHKTLKGRAKELHNKIREKLPMYAEVEQRKGLKPISYGDFRRKALQEKKQKDVRLRIRSLSSKSSYRSRSSSVRSIISGKSENQTSVQKKNMLYMQRKKSVAIRARQSCKKRYQKQYHELEQKLGFLRDQDGDLNIKIDELTTQLATLQLNIGSSLALSRKNSKGQF